MSASLNVRFRRVARLLSLAAPLGVLAISSACSSSEPPPPPAPAMKSAEARVQWYQDCWAHYNNKAWDQFQTCYAENATSEGVDAPMPPRSGRAAIIDFAKQETAAFTDRRGDPVLVLGNGSRLASVALWTATNDGPMPPGPDGKPMPATNKKVGLYMAHTVDLDPTGSSAARDAAYVDEGVMMAQLGVSPAPARAPIASTGMAPTVVIAKNDETENRNIAAARASVDVWNARDVKAVEATMADGYKMIEMGQPKDMDKAEAIAGAKEFWGGFPDLKITPVDVWAAGDYVVMTGTVEGTNTGDMPSMGVKKTGKALKLKFLEVFKFDAAGKMTEDWLFYNGAAFASQLGLGK
jgi:hypothetical protein